VQTEGIRTFSSTNLYKMEAMAQDVQDDDRSVENIILQL
jgi:hypothetical protein